MVAFEGREGKQAQASCSTAGFLRLISWLKWVVLLQDLALLLPYLEQINHPIANCSLVRLNAFKDFQRTIVERVATADDPLDKRVREVMPIVAEKMSDLGSSLERNNRSMDQSSQQ